MKKFLFISLIFIILLLGFAAGAYYKIEQFAEVKVTAVPNQILVLERGTTGKKLATFLESEQVIANATLLPWLLKLHPELNQIKAGTYSLDDVHTVTDLLHLLNSGKEAQFATRFNEGSTFKTWISILSAAPYMQHTLADKSEQEIFALLELPQQPDTNIQKIEGWLYPDTYYYVANSTDLSLLKRASQQMKKYLQQAWEMRDKTLPLKTDYELLILASIIEKETGLDKERGVVASVFVNRLRKSMKLQTDPTVIYGMGDNYNGDIKRKDLQEATEYNTYVIDGLPPSPIAMPSIASLQAAANPEETDFLYFVADGTGGHKFSTNLADHNRAVKEYWRWYRNQKKPAS